MNKEEGIENPSKVSFMMKSFPSILSWRTFAEQVINFKIDPNE